MVTGFVTKVIRTISLARVLIWAMTAMLCITVYTIYENRLLFSARFTSPSISSSGVTFNVGIETGRRVREIVTGDKEILELVILSSDIRLNEAKSVFAFADDPLLASIDETERAAGPIRLPLFTTADDNSDILKLINGTFTCQKASASIFGRLNPEITKTTKYICMSSIPSYYGYFSGYLAVFLSDSPSIERQAQLKGMMDRLANDVYFRDVLSTQHADESDTVPVKALK